MAFEKGHKTWNRIDLDCDLVKKLYLDKGMTAEEIQRELSLKTAHPVYRTLRELGLTRKNSEALKLHYKDKRPPNYKGGTYDGSGYKVIRIKSSDPFYKMTSNGMIREHRYVMAKHLGRCLDDGEVVHHLNGNRSDNRIENLQLYASHSEHMREHMTTELATRIGLTPKRKNKAVGCEVDAE